eukprot:4592537-Pleurochrysis_carterae.AAC.1
MSTVATSTPRARISDANVECARPSPAKRMSARGVSMSRVSAAASRPPCAAASSLRFGGGAPPGGDATASHDRGASPRAPSPVTSALGASPRAQGGASRWVL